ncbi:MAG: chemotaxis protein CheB [Planctomycetaceae bacterium]
MAQKKKPAEQQAGDNREPASSAVKRIRTDRPERRMSAESPGDAGFHPASQPVPPDRSSHVFPIVGIGASAGGLAALKEFFAHVPGDSGMAFVVVIHLSPEHKSHLTEVLQPHVGMPVQQVNETVQIEQNRVYVIPPNANLDTIDTHLRLTKLEEQRRERAPIDHFFRTLAKTHDGQAIGVILTGTGSDGAIGLRDIKEGGGLVIAQDPNEAEFDGMPQSAIATGLVDLVLPLAKIPEAVIRFARTQPRLPIAEGAEDVEGEARRQLHQIFAQLRTRTRRDFTRYKRSTILRRIQRRMRLRQIDELPEYLALLHEQPEEVRNLADDLLITVTNFFRDAEVFQTLEQDVIPQLFAGKGELDEIRVWSVGCATGEEPYSLAMLLMEEAMRRNAAPRLQIFASDLHERSLERARQGLYLGDIEADVSPERLKRFFIKESGGYRIRKELRELVVFAPHNLLGDPPFSRLDLIACRNVLIYLQRDVQRDIIELFHYALRPNGFLSLGTSETVDSSDLFLVHDKKRCIYRKRNVPAPEPRLPVFPLTRSRLAGGAEYPQRPGEPVVYGMLHQQMVERFAPPSALISPDDKIVHLSEHAGRYLVHPGGELTASAFKLIRDELRIELRAALHMAREGGGPVRSKPIPVRFGGETVPVVLNVRPSLDKSQKGFALVIFDERPANEQPDEKTAEPMKHGGAAPAAPHGSAREMELETELDVSRQRLQAIIEEYETGQEEMKAANEELQSANEELRSTMEELETSKEELQSMNEELQTVNQENRHKVEELAQMTSDLQNLMAATDIATLFLDRDLRILRFTPKVTELFNLRAGDSGRPLSDITHHLGYPEMIDDAGQVLTRLIPVKREVNDSNGHWYLTQVLPYRSAEDRIEGVVITFVEITDLRLAQRSQQELLSRMNGLIKHAPWGVILFDTELRIVSMNGPIAVGGAPSQTSMQSLENCIGKTLSETIPALAAKVEPMLQRVRDTGESISSTEVTGETASEPEQSRHWLASFYPIYDADRRIDGIGAVVLEITDRIRAEEAVRTSEARLAAELAGMNRLHDFVARLLVCNDLRTALDEVLAAAIDITDADLGMIQLVDPQTSGLGIVTQRGFTEKFLEEFGEKTTDLSSPCSRCLLQGERVIIKDVQHDPEFEAEKPIAAAAGYRSEQCTPLLSRDGGLLGVLSTHYREPSLPSERDMRMLDLYARQAADFIEHIRYREAMSDADRRKDEFLATLAHELRNPLAPISSGLQLMKLADDKAATYEQIGGTLERQLRQLVTLVDDLLDISRITSGKLQLKKSTVDLAAILENAVEASRPLIDEMEHELTVDVPDESIRLQADPHRLAQVVSNLLNNAAKYTPRKGRVWLTARREGSVVVVSVKDNGVGIAADQFDRIFEMFGQIDNVHELGAGGLGIGLTLVKSLMEMHGGIVEIHSDGADQGSEFTVRLPIVTGHAGDVPANNDAGTNETSGVRRRVLVVDDNKAAAEMLSRVVMMLGNEVRTAGNGVEAVTLAEGFRPDIVLMDLGMPKMNGYEAAQKIRQQAWGKEMMLVALTGWGQVKDRGRTEEAGFDHHLVKPARPSDLRQLIARAEHKPK